MTDKESKLIDMIFEEHGVEISIIFLDEYQNYKLSWDLENDNDKYLYTFFSKFIQIKFLNPISYLKSASSILNELPTIIDDDNDNSKSKGKNQLQIEHYNHLIDNPDINFKNQDSLLKEFIENYNLKENDDEISRKRNKYLKKIFKEKDYNDKSF